MPKSRPTAVDPNGRSVRVFLSSTFRDFGQERDLLVRRVFPSLRARLRERFVELVDVDLRWGITAEQAERGEVLPICLAEIDRARPYFVGMLGERYGWIPSAGQYPQALLERQPWLRQHLGGKSVTELEILHGVLNNTAMADRALFYFRSATYAREKGKAHAPGSPDEQHRQAELKARIRASGFPVVLYRDPEAFARLLERDLWALLDAEFPPHTVPDPYELEAMRHTAYAAPRQTLYFGNAGSLRALHQAIDRGEARILVQGTAGIGKSALMANWLQEHRRSRPRDQVFEHYLGVGADAADPCALLRRLIEFIRRETRSSDEVAIDIQALIDSLPLWLARAAAWARKRRTRFIFALDALQGLTDLQDLRWLPAFLPGGVSFVVSCRAGPVLDALKAHKKASAWTTVPVKALPASARRSLLGDYLARFNKRLPRPLTAQVLAHPLSGNPLFLRTLAEELRLFGVHEELARRLAHYLASESVDALYEKVLARVEGDCGRRAVKTAMLALWSSRAGLTEKEILGVASLSTSHWARIRNALDDALLETGGRINFAHDYARQAVKQRYAPAPHDERRLHAHLGRWFARQPLDRRRTQEQPYQLGQAHAWAALERLLCDARSFSGIVEFQGTLELLNYWNQLQRNGRAGPGVTYQRAWKRWKRDTDAKTLAGLARQLTSFLYRFGDFSAFAVQVARASIDLSSQIHGSEHEETGYRMSDLGLLLQETHRLDEALDWSRRALHIFERSGSSPSNLSRQISNIARVLQAQGKLKEAGAAFRRALEVMVQALNTENDESVAVLHNNLAMLLHDEGDLGGSRHHYERALAIVRHVSGATSPLSGIFSKNLGCLHQDLGDHRRALTVLSGAAEVIAGALGPSHIECAYTESRIGISLYRLKRFEEAVPRFERAREIVATVFEPTHPEFISASNNLQAARKNASGA